MAYWGEAMTHNHALWKRQEKEDALKALDKLAPDAKSRTTLATTEIEKDFMRSLEVLYGEGTKYDRDIAYKDFMKGLTEKYPDQHEVSAFYAVSLLGSSRNGRDDELYGKSAKIAESIIKENANHPGALHYLIHSYDDPVHAHLARQAADRYSKVAPDAAHALHMPSHIYVAQGNWDEVVKSNIASWNASVKRKERKELGPKSRSYHALNWLQYGLLERGEVEQATRLVHDMIKYAEEDDRTQALDYLVAMKGAHMVETNSWSGEIADIEIDLDDLYITKKAGHNYLEGMKAYHKNDAKAVAAIISDMEKDRVKASLTVGEKGFAMCSSGSNSKKPASQIDIDMAEIMEMELEAYLATLNGNLADAKKWFKKATDLDESLNYSFGPPLILKPVHEAFGEWLLEQNQLEEAYQVFEKSLNRHPRRLLSLQGQRKAALELKKESAIAKIDKELEISLASRERPEVL